MAVLFVIYIPVEDVSEPADDDYLDKNKKALELEPQSRESGIPRVDSKQKFREVASTSDIALMQQQMQQQRQQDNNLQVSPATTQQNEDIEYSSESKPLLGAITKSVSPSKIPKSASSNVLMDRSQQQPQPQMTTTTTTTTLQSADNTLPKSFYKEIPNSRFKVSLAAENLINTSANDVMKFPRRESVVPGDMFNDDSVEFVKEVITLKEYLEDKLAKLKISNHVWQKTIDDSLWMINFMVSHEQCDQVFNSLTCCGFGKIPGTSLSIFPTSAHKEEQNESEDDIAARTKSSNEKSEFMKSIKSSLTVAQVVGAISNGAALTFDYLLLIFLASMIAGFGLAENSSVVLVASMLISPLMGPIIGFTFGIVINNMELCKLSVRTELIGLSICLGYGFLFGLITGAIDNTSARYGADGVWPTSEMQARGMLRSLWVGIFIALPSGAGVALAILGGNTGSLVGVAISASLLPPLVNAGMLWGLACVSALNPPPLKITEMVSNLTDLSYPAPPNCPELLGNSYKMVYSCTMSFEAAFLGSVSLLLAILNIICIFFMGVIVMKIKELSPLPGATKGSVSFWKKDVPIMRHTYETIKGPKSLDMRRMAKELVKEIKQKNPSDWENIVKDVKDDPIWKDINNGLEPKQDILQVMTEEKNMEDDEFDDQLNSRRYQLQQQHSGKLDNTEILLNDQRYQTISGNIAPFRSHIRDLFGNQDDESTGDLSQTASVATTPTASKMPIGGGGGGCIVRMRRTHHKSRPKSANDRKFSDSQAMSYHNNNVSTATSGDPNNHSHRANDFDDDEEEDEVLMLNYNKVAHFKKHPYVKKRATSIACGGLDKSPGSHVSATPTKSLQTRIRFDEDNFITFK